MHPHSALRIVHVEDSTPPFCPRTEVTYYTQSAKRWEVGGGSGGVHRYLKFAQTSRRKRYTKLNMPQNFYPKHRLTTQMWLGFPIHEAMATQRASRIIKEKQMDAKFLTTGK